MILSIFGIKPNHNAGQFDGQIKKIGSRETQLRRALLTNIYLILKILKGDIVLNTLPLCRAGAHIEPTKTLKMTIIIINQQCRRGVHGGGGAPRL